MSQLRYYWEDSWKDGQAVKAGMKTLVARIVNARCLYGYEYLGTCPSPGLSLTAPAPPPGLSLTVPAPPPGLSLTCSSSSRSPNAASRGPAAAAPCSSASAVPTSAASARAAAAASAAA